MLQQKNQYPKQFLAAVRQGDYAHPGEEEAINLVMQHIAKIPGQLLLDVGSGLGGTAHYLKNHGCGLPLGIDIDAVSIDYANKKYPDIKFKLCDVLKAPDIFARSAFDVIYLFNSFYAFKDQAQALTGLSLLAKPGAQLIIFDYMIPKIVEVLHVTSPFASGNSSFSKSRTNFIPIYEKTIEILLLDSGWVMESLININLEYLNWYQQFMSRLKMQQKELISRFGDELYGWAHDGYSDLLNRLKQNTLSGGLIIARKS